LKILVTIPHFFESRGNNTYGSTSGDAGRRATALGHCLSGLHQSLGPRQAFLLCLHPYIPGKGNGQLAKVNTHAATRLDIAVCTAGDSHVLPLLQVAPGLFHHQPTSSAPMMLGFACHRILKANLGKYDFYAYVEDDLLVHDAMFLAKIRWFAETFGDDCVLFPHRYESDPKQPVQRLYIDGPVRPDFSANWQDVNDRRTLEGGFPGSTWMFERWPNPHSGCFFLSAAQMERWAASPHFDDADCSFAGPLESAASLGIMKHFRIYKPSAANAGFLEIQHLHNRYLGESLRLQ
jgi:hypothetical protein